MRAQKGSHSFSYTLAPRSLIHEIEQRARAYPRRPRTEIKITVAILIEENAGHDQGSNRV